MGTPGKIQKLDEVVVNRIAAGEVIQRPANALKELIENSLDAKSTNIQITVKDGGLKSLQIQDNGTGIRRDDLAIVCERFTTSKLRKFDDLKSISTFGFRGEALASMSHVAHLTITTKTIEDKVAYRASYIDGKLKSAPKPIAGNQGTTILIENLFHNVATRRKALSNPSDEFTRIGDVVTKYSIHNPHVGFILKKQGEVIATVRTPPNSTKINNIKQLFGNTVARELLDIELIDDRFQFKMHSLITNPNYSGKRLSLTIFINHRLIDSTPIRKMIEDLYSIYLPKKTYPWCYISLEINPENVDVNVHPTKYEVRFLHEDSIIEKVKTALDERLSSTSATRTFYVQARLPQVAVTKDVLEKVLPEYDQEKEKSKRIYAKEMIRTDANDQKLDRFNFRVQKMDKLKEGGLEAESSDDIDDLLAKEQEVFEKRVASCCLGTPRKEAVVAVDSRLEEGKNVEVDKSLEEMKTPKNAGRAEADAHWSSLVDEPTPEFFKTSSTVLKVKSPEKSGDDVLNAKLRRKGDDNRLETKLPEKGGDDDLLFPKDVLDLFSSADESSNDAAEQAEVNSSIANRALKNIYQYFGSQKTTDDEEVEEKRLDHAGGIGDEDETLTPEKSPGEDKKSGDEEAVESKDESEASAKPSEFKSYSINNFRREVHLTSVLKLRKNVEDNYHEGLKKILGELTFVGCVDEDLALIQSDVNLYICNTTKLAEELFYEIMLYDFGNYGVIRFSEPLPLYDLAMLGLETEEADWSEEDGPKEEIAGNVRDLLIEKSDMLKEYFAIVIDKRGNLKSLPVLLEKYFPSQAEIPLFILRLSTEVEWSIEQPCFDSICRETAKFYSKIDANDTNDLSSDWKHITEHVLYPAIKESLLPPKHFAHDSTILQIASLPNLYKVFERC